MSEAGTEESWLIDWFRKQNPELSSISTEKMMTSNYFLSEYIDSFGVITLINDAERAFNVRFDERDFQDRRFATIAGLSEIIRDRGAE